MVWGCHKNISPRKFILSTSNYVEKMEDCARDLCIRCFHMCSDIWKAAEGEVLECERETGNAKDRYAVAVKKDATVIGHLPKRFPTYVHSS